MSELQLLKLLRQVPDNTLWGQAIHIALEKNIETGEIVLQLLSQYCDNPEGMSRILGPELTLYLTSKASYVPTRLHIHKGRRNKPVH